MSSHEEEASIMGNAMRSQNCLDEGDGAERFDGVGVELWEATGQW